MTQALKGITIILGCYFLGDLLSRLIGGFMPGSILGMILLFLLLKTKVVKREDIKAIAELVLNNMMIFFVPVTVGIVNSFDAISDQIVGVVSAILLSTLAVLLSSGFVQQFISRRWKK